MMVACHFLSAFDPPLTAHVVLSSGLFLYSRKIGFLSMNHFITGVLTT